MKPYLLLVATLLSLTACTKQETGETAIQQPAHHADQPGTSFAATDPKTPITLLPQPTSPPNPPSPIPNDQSQAQPHPNAAGQPVPAAQATASQTVTLSREPPENADDLALSTRIRDALEQESSTAHAAQLIRISSSNGRVTLQGVVGSEQEKIAILDVVRTVDGVKSINDQIRVARNELSTAPQHLPPSK